MAEVFESLKEARIKLNDPSGVINILTVSNYEALPVSPISQTAYRTEDTGEYFIFSGSSFEKLELKISDETLNTYISLYGITGAILRGIDLIVAQLYNQIMASGFSTGSENVQFTTLKDAIEFYKTLRKQYADQDAENSSVSSGLYIETTRPRIGGYSY